MLKATSDDRSTIYVDGRPIINTYVWQPVVIEIKAKAKLLAVEVISMLLYVAFMAETSTKVVTDKTWRCTNEPQPDNWMNLDFDDSRWPPAFEFALNSDGYMLMTNIPIFPPERIWISVNDITSRRMFCRKRLDSA